MSGFRIVRAKLSVLFKSRLFLLRSLVSGTHIAVATQYTIELRRGSMFKSQKEKTLRTVTLKRKYIVEAKEKYNFFKT